MEKSTLADSPELKRAIAAARVASTCIYATMVVSLVVVLHWYFTGVQHRVFGSVLQYALLGSVIASSICDRWERAVRTRAIEAIEAELARRDRVERITGKTS